MKLFETASIDVVKDCQSCFAIDLPSCVHKRRQDKFILRYTVNVFLPILQLFVILYSFFIVKFAVIVVVYVATSLMNEDEYINFLKVNYKYISDRYQPQLYPLNTLKRSRLSSQCLPFSFEPYGWQPGNVSFKQIVN